MERVKAWEKRTLVTELTQGMELVNQLKDQIDPLASPEECDLLLQKIICSLEKSLSILNLKARCSSISPPGVNIFESTVAFLGNNNPTKCEVLDLNSLSDQVHNRVFKKRKKLQEWSSQVRLSVTGLEGPHEDGHSWRKYGQKDIFGAKHPRGYYRCTHRNTQGCLATKQVQRSDEDQSIFEVKYIGRHSCKTSNSPNISWENQNQNPKQNKNQYGPNHIVETLLNIKQEDISSTPLKSEFPDTQFFSNSISTISSPTTSEFMYLPNDKEVFEIDQILQSSQPGSRHTELILTPTSVINSPFGGDWDLPMDDQLDFDHGLMFDDISEYFV